MFQESSSKYCISVACIDIFASSFTLNIIVPAFEIDQSACNFRVSTCKSLPRAFTSTCFVSGISNVASIQPWLLKILLVGNRSEEHTSELQSRENLVCRLLLEKKNKSQRRLRR